MKITKLNILYYIQRFANENYLSWQVPYSWYLSRIKPILIRNGRYNLLKWQNTKDVFVKCN